MNHSELISLIGVILGCLSFCGGFILWWKGSIEKRYAAQRDFGHLKRNQEQLISNLAHTAEKQESELVEIRSDLKEIKALSLSLSQRFELILVRLESQSGIFGKRND